MNQLSIHAINESSSYEVSEVSDGCYQFFTDTAEQACSIKYKN